MSPITLLFGRPAGPVIDKGPMVCACLKVAAKTIDEAAIGFYERHGFVRSPLGERVMLMPIETARSLVGPTPGESGEINQCLELPECSARASSTTSRGSASTSIGGSGRYRRLFRFGL